MAILYRESLDRVFHALGDGTRRQMISLLSQQGEMSAGQLAERFAIAQPTASKHIKVLEKAHLIERIVQGRIHTFRIKKGTMAEAEAWLNRHRHFWMSSVSRLKKLVEQKKHKQ